MNEISTIKIENRTACGKAIAGLIVLVVFHSALLAGGLQPRREGVRSASLGFAMTAVRNDPWAISWNPAACGVLTAASVYASPQPFGLPALAHFGAAVALPFGSGAASCSLVRHGTDLYRETAASVAWMQPVAEGVRLGTAIRGWHVGIERYGSAAAVSVDVGVLFEPLRQLAAGACASNVTLSRIGSGEGERLPVLLALGVAWTPDSTVLLAADVVHDQRYPISARVGVEYWILGALALRVGATSDPALFTAGMGVAHAGWKAHYSFAVHADLGGTHSAGIEFQPSGGLF